MKFCSSNPIKGLFFIAALVVSLSAVAQKNSYSPYSRFGLGEQISQSSAANLGMGGVSTPIIDPFNVNTQNPASYAFFFRPILNVGAQVSSLKLSNKYYSETLPYSNPLFINMAFKREGGHTGWVLGIRPYTSIGYNVNKDIFDPTAGAINYNQEGDGGILRSYVGAGRKFDIRTKKIRKDDKGIEIDTLLITDEIAFGANVNYYFGTLTNSETVQFSNPSYLNSRFSNYTSISNLSADFGLLYKHHLKVLKHNGNLFYKTDIVFGADYELGSSMHIKTEQVHQTFQRIVFRDFPLDTALYVAGANGVLGIPQKLKLGLALVFRSTEGSTLTLAVDYGQKDWTSFEVKEGTFKRNSYFITERDFAFGGSYTPKEFLQNYDSPLLALATYRLGIKHNGGYIQLGDHKISASSITGGITLPLRHSNSASKFNLGMEFGKRGTIEDNLIKEQFFNAFIGFSFSPSYIDQWFKRRKYD